MPHLFSQILTLCQKSVFERQQKSRSDDDKNKDRYERTLNILDDWSDEEEYDEDEDYDPEETKESSEDLYKSFTQEIDEVLQAKQAFEALESNIFDLYFGGVSREDQNSLQKCFNDPLVTQ
mmetsp:Transcript_10365/g.9158  ORF Transcript_10365/g.9158 Transcript_10365/m.9158 type:complete len:121 (+) Transcript_10365:946-1308(+)